MGEILEQTFKVKTFLAFVHKNVIIIIQTEI